MTREDVGTVAGVLVFVGGGLATVLTAITNFGVTTGPVDLARRNHPLELTLAAAFAAGGLFCGATYTVMKEEGVVSKELRESVLIQGVGLVAAGVILGIVAVVFHQAGRPYIAFFRPSADAAQVRVSAEGLSSDTAFSLIVRGYKGGGNATNSTVLLRGRFSPGPDGKLDRQWLLNLAPLSDRGAGRGAIRYNYLFAAVFRESVSQRRVSHVSYRAHVGSCERQSYVETCLFERVPPVSAQAPNP